MFAKLASTLRHAEIDGDDLEIAERALRGLARRYREDAQRHIPLHESSRAWRKGAQSRRVLNGAGMHLAIRA